MVQARQAAHRVWALEGEIAVELEQEEWMYARERELEANPFRITNAAGPPTFSAGPGEEVNPFSSAKRADPPEQRDPPLTLGLLRSSE